MPWRLIGGLAAGASFLVGRAVYRRSSQEAAARAAGLQPARDLQHLPQSLQRTALWSLADGGFERRVVHGKLARARGDVALTAFDLETLRERRGEWAWLPVDRRFRVGGVVSVVVCEVDREFPHVLCKRTGRGDELIDDNMLQRLGHIAKSVRDGLGVKRSLPAELPKALPVAALDVAVHEQWRAYSQAPDFVASLLDAGFRATLEQAHRRDLVVELLDRLVVIYPAARDVAGADAFADLTSTALQIVDGVLAATPPLTPRGIEHVTTS